MGILKPNRTEPAVDWKRIEKLVHGPQPGLNEFFLVGSAEHLAASGVSGNKQRASMTVCTMCQGTTPKGRPCEYCGRAT